MTIDAVRARTKTVTRRHVETWQTLKPGDRLTLVEKAQGLHKGERQVVLAEVEVTDVRVEKLIYVSNAGEVNREGFPNMAPVDFAEMWAHSHGYRSKTRLLGDVPVRRIEWRYLR